MSEERATYAFDPEEYHDWRCPWPGCIVRPRIGRYLDSGGVEIRSSGRQGRPGAWVFDANLAIVRGHCGSCHRWSVVGRWENGLISAKIWTGHTPDIGCPGCNYRTRGDNSTDSGGPADSGAGDDGPRLRTGTAARTD